MDGVYGRQEGEGVVEMRAVAFGASLSEETTGAAAQIMCRNCGTRVLTPTFAEALRLARRHHRATGHTVGARSGQEEWPAPAA